VLETRDRDVAEAVVETMADYHRHLGWEGMLPDDPAPVAVAVAS
jgi:hypothetical protein